MPSELQGLAPVTAIAAGLAARIEITVLKLIGVFVNWTKAVPATATTPEIPARPLVNLSFTDDKGRIIKRTLGEDAKVLDEASALAIEAKAKARLASRMTVVPVTGAIGILDEKPEARGSYKLAAATFTDPVVIEWSKAERAAPTLDQSSVDDL
jgi:hypothetical protein